MKPTGKETFILRALKLFDNLDYSKINYVNNKTPICIVCRVHGDFWLSPRDHLRGYSCPKCRLDRIVQDFLRRAQEIHKNKYSYLEVNYVLSKEKVCIICPDHGRFWQSPHNHLDGKGCRICARINAISKNTDSLEAFLDKAKTKHNNFYNYIKVDYKNCKTKVCIICPVHGEFWQTPNSHTQGRGCSKCVSHVSYRETQWLDSLKLPSLIRQKTLFANNTWFKVDAFDPATNTVYEFYGDYWHGNPNVYPANKVNFHTGTTFGSLYEMTLKREFILKQYYNISTMWESNWVLVSGV